MLPPRLMLAITKCRTRRGTTADSRTERGLSSPQQRKESGAPNLFEAVESCKVSADWKVRAPSAILKGLNNSAQGCESASYPGIMRLLDDNPERVAAPGNGSATRPQPRWGCETSATFTQGSSSLATL